MTLLKSSLQSLPKKYRLLFWILFSMASALESIQKLGVEENSRIPWVNWEDVCLKTINGALG